MTKKVLDGFKIGDWVEVDAVIRKIVSPTRSFDAKDWACLLSRYTTCPSVTHKAVIVGKVQRFSGVTITATGDQQNVWKGVHGFDLYQIRLSMYGKLLDADAADLKRCSPGVLPRRDDTAAYLPFSLYRGCLISTRADITDKIVARVYWAKYDLDIVELLCCVVCKRWAPATLNKWWAYHNSFTQVPACVTAPWCHPNKEEARKLDAMHRLGVEFEDSV